MANDFAKAEEKPLLRQYRGMVTIPDDLYQAYERLVTAFRGTDERAIKAICLPRSIVVTSDPKRLAAHEYQGAIKLPFVKAQFAENVLEIRKESDGVFVLQTASSYLGFVETRQKGWMLYRYGDRPIE